MNPTTIVFLLASFLACQTTRPAADPATTLSRAKLALEMGDLVRAEGLLQEASSAPDPAVASEARRRLAELAPRMGKGPGSPRPGGDSPIAVRVRDAVQKMEREPGLAKEVVEEITWIGEAAVPSLGSWIDDPSISTATRDALVGAAAKIGGEASLGLLERLADSPDDLLRRRAMEAFVAGVREGGSVPYSGARWTAVAGRYLGDRDPLTRQLALRGLRNFPEAIRGRLAALAADPDSGVRSTLVQYFFLTLPEAAKETLLADPDARVRQTMAQMLTRREWSDSRPVALRLLRDADPSVRRQALDALPKTSSPEPFDPSAIRAALAPLVADPSVDVRRSLAGSAQNLVGPAAVPLLLPLLLDEQSAVFEGAMSALERLPRGGLRHEDLPKALEIAPAVVRRHGFRDPSREKPTLADRYAQFLATMVQASGAKGDFPVVAKAFAGMPGLAAAGAPVAQALLAVATPEDVPDLCDLYDRVPDYASRAAVLRVLEGKVEGLLGEGAKRVAALLGSALAPETDPLVREEALFVALKLRAAALGPAMAEALRTRPNNRNWDLVGPALLAMGKTAPREAAECIVAFTTSRETLLGQHGAAPLEWAAGYLASFPSPVAIPAMTRILEQAPNHGVRAAVVSNVPDQGGAEWTAFLLDVVLATPDAGLRRVGIERLAQIRAFSPEVVARITAAAEDSDGGIRVEVLEYVQAWNSPEAAPIARRLLKDPAPNVRQIACQVLGSLVAQEAVPDLLAALLDDRTNVRSAAKAALDQIRFYHEEKKRWEDWYEGRGTDPGEGIRKLLELLDDPNEPIRVSAIESLGTMKAKEALPRLVETIKKGASRAEREAAAKAVERINRE
ncbi:MAG: HEAT repeat domain-containing protein [Planctomycetes bacterium]|nr:HEAT repeat domain-containing protein [Planctomycetota bacterium]